MGGKNGVLSTVNAISTGQVASVVILLCPIGKCKSCYYGHRYAQLSWGTNLK